MKKAKPTEPVKVRCELQFIVDITVNDPDNMVEISRATIEKFKTGIRQSTISITEGIVKTEIL